MFNYISNLQLSITEFRTPFQAELPTNNRWVKLSQIIPWDELATIYHQKLSKGMGRPGINSRVVIGAMIIKHKQNLSDEETIATIAENPFMQYFLGLTGFKAEPIFDPSLFVTLRKRLGNEAFDQMNQVLITKATEAETSGTKGRKKTKSSPSTACVSPPTDHNEPQREQPAEPDAEKRKGKLILDATVAEHMIKYPTDLGLLNQCRLECERLIDLLYDPVRDQLKTKPRTYRRNAKGLFTNMAKNKKKTKQKIRKAIGQQLRFVGRNIGHIDKLLDLHQDKTSGIMPNHPLKSRDLKIYWALQHIYSQQLEMYSSRTHQCPDRIVSLYQPHIRPILRGKDKHRTEFGPKLGVSLENGYSRLSHFSWDAYNESSDLPSQVMDYKQLHGYFPEVVIVDQLYGTRANRSWLKEHGIRFSGKPLGRPPKQAETAYQKRKKRQERNMRNQIEGKFGQGKNAYALNKVRTRLATTSESCIAAIFFVMNIIRLEKDLFFVINAACYGFIGRFRQLIELLASPKMPSLSCSRRNPNLETKYPCQ